MRGTKWHWRAAVPGSGIASRFWIFALGVAAVVHSPTARADTTITALRLDGSSLTGQLKEWNQSDVVIATEGGDERLAVDQLLSLRRPAPPAEAAQPPSAGLVELTDGSIVPFQQFEVTGAKATLAVKHSQSADAQTLKLPTKTIVAVRFRPLDEALAQQWEEIRSLKLTGDAVVPLNKDGKSLDYTEGVLGNISTEKVEFKLDDDPLRVDRAKLAGAIYYRRESAKMPETKCIVHGKSGFEARAAKIELAEETLTVICPSGATLHWPLDDIRLIDFSTGKIVYLSDAEPVSARATPLIDFRDSKALDEWTSYHRDRSAFGGPLTLPAEDDAGATTHASVRTFNKGLALRSRTELVYKLPGGFNRFAAIAGIDRSTSTSGSVRLQIFADDRSLWERDIAGDQPAQSIDVEISGAKRLRVLVDYGPNGDSGDWLNLGDARIVK